MATPEAKPETKLPLKVTLIGKRHYNDVEDLREVYDITVRIRGESSYPTIFSQAMNALSGRTKLNPNLISDFQFRFQHPPPAQLISIPE